MTKKNDIISVPKEMQELIDLKKEYEEKVRGASGQKAVKALFTDLFDKYPEVKAVRWTQYTPYFNDGDPCEFGLGQFWLGIDKDTDHNMEPDEEFDDAHEDNDLTFVADFGRWDNKTCTVVYNSDRHRELEDALNAVQEACYQLEDVLETSFGDHVKVTVTRTKIDVDDCDHD